MKAKVQHKIYATTSVMDAETWNAYTDGSFHFSHHFLSALKKSHVEDAQYRYLMFERDDRPVGFAVLSAFVLNLDLLAGDNAMVRALKSVFPALWKVKVTIAGTVGSFGQPPYCCLDSQYEDEIIRQMENALEKWSTELKSKLLIWKEIPSNSHLESLHQLGYQKLPSLPDMQLGIEWKSIEDYLHSLRSNYRRKVSGDASNWSAKSMYELKPFSIEDVDSFYAGYQGVISRTDTKLEIYPREFFQQLASYSNDRVELLTTDSEGKSISGLIYTSSSSLSLLLVSKPEDKYDEGLYNSLINGVVFTAIERGVNRIYFGQTSEYSKACTGAEPVALSIFMRNKSKLNNAILRGIAPTLFPKRKTSELRVFKGTAA